jgi:hypothetical protein
VVDVEPHYRFLGHSLTSRRPMDFACGDLCEGAVDLLVESTAFLCIELTLLTSA